MKTKEINHTPWPWAVAPAKGTLCAWQVTSQTRPTIAFVAQTLGNNQEENANAKLIAAAPDLAQALLKCVQNMEDDIRVGSWAPSVYAVHKALLDAANAALQKAGCA